MPVDLRFFNPWADTTIGANRLPHWDQPGAAYFITFRLADSLPAALLAKWASDREVWLNLNPEPWRPEQEREYHDRFSGTLERWLDDGHGECLLRRPDVRTAVVEAFTKFDRERYWHHAWVVMPNHAHMLVSIREGAVLAELLKAWKGASSHAAGAILKQDTGRRDAAFWQKDYFDRLIRDRQHFWNCARYIRRNPLKARQRKSDYSLYCSEQVLAVLDSLDARGG